MKILLLEDDSVLSDILKDFLSESYDLKHCFNSSDALDLAENEVFDLYIFDINVPGIDGVQLLKSLRDFSDMTPAIFITAYSDTKHLTSAFKHGANDFIRKPFELEELQARIENIKKQFNLDSEILIEDGILFDANTQQIIKNQKPINISIKQSQLLHYLIQNKNRVISSDELRQNLWSYDDMPADDSIRTYIKDLRKIIGSKHIVNIRSLGYRFE